MTTYQFNGAIAATTTIKSKRFVTVQPTTKQAIDTLLSDIITYNQLQARKHSLVGNRFAQIY